MILKTTMNVFSTSSQEINYPSLKKRWALSNLSYKGKIIIICYTYMSTCAKEKKHSYGQSIVCISNHQRTPRLRLYDGEIKCLKVCFKDDVNGY